MRKCRFCQQPIDDAATVCPHCGRDLIPGRTPPMTAALAISEASKPAAADPAEAPIARVSVVDINMPFASMVGFMVKWALAAIPAFVILFMLGLLLFGILAAIGARP